MVLTSSSYLRATGWVCGLKQISSLARMVVLPQQSASLLPLSSLIDWCATQSLAPAPSARLIHLGFIEGLNSLDGISFILSPPMRNPSVGVERLSISAEASCSFRRRHLYRGDCSVCARTFLALGDQSGGWTSSLKWSADRRYKFKIWGIWLFGSLLLCVCILLFCVPCLELTSLDVALTLSACSRSGLVVDPFPAGLAAASVDLLLSCLSQSGLSASSSRATSHRCFST